jgi:hypothetical protein
VEARLLTEGGFGNDLKGLEPVTRNWLKSAPNDFAKSYGSLAVDTFGLVVKTSAPRAQIIAAL